MKKPYKVLSATALAAVLATSSLVPVIAQAAPANQIKDVIVSKDGVNYKMKQSQYDSLVDAGKVPGTVAFITSSTGKTYTINQFNNAIDSSANVDEALTKLDTTATAQNPTTVDATFDSNGNLVTTPVAGDLKVESVTAINGTTMEVKFTQPVNASTVYNTSTKVIDASAITITPTATAGAVTAGNLKGELSEDGKTLKVSLTGGTEFFDGTYTVEVLKDKIKLKDDAKKFIGVYKELVTADDTAGPSVTNVKYDGSKAIVTFSEAVKDEGTVSLDGVQLTSGAGYTAFSAGGKELEILNLTPGKTYKLNVVGATDIAGNYSTPNALDVTLAPPVDTVKPAVTTTVDGTKVTFKFSKELKLQALAGVPETEYAKVTLGNGTPVYLTAAEQDSVDGKVFVKDFIGDVTGEFLNSTIKVENFQDKVGNVGVEYSTPVTLKKDKTAPKLVSTTTEGKNIILKYDEATTNNALAAGDVKITYTDSEGVLYPAAAPATIGTVVDSYDANGNGVIDGDENNYIVIPVTDNTFTTATSLKAGSYKVAIAAAKVQDTAATPNTVDAHTATFAVTADATAKELVELTSADQGANPGEINVVFNNLMDASALNASNYKLGGTVLPSNAKLTFVGNKKNVLITLPEGYVTATGKRVLEVSNVKDTDGNILKPANKSVTTTSVLKENVKPTATKVVLVNGQNLAVNFSEALATLPSPVNGLKVKVNGVDVALDGAAPFTLSADKKVLTVKASAAEAFKLSDTITVEVKDTNIADAAGNTVKNVTLTK